MQFALVVLPCCNCMQYYTNTYIIIIIYIYMKQVAGHSPDVDLCVPSEAMFRVDGSRDQMNVT